MHWLLPILLGCVGSAGSFVLGWLAHAWSCRRHNADCPVWRQEHKAAWKAKLRRRYPNGRHERHPTTEVALDDGGRAGIPLQRRDTPTAETDLANPKRRTP